MTLVAVTIGAIASAKKKHELRHTIAVLYNSIEKTKEGLLSKKKGETAATKFIGKIFPILVKGQAIEVGKCFEFGPLCVIPSDHDGCICAEVVCIPESLEHINTNAYYKPEFYKDRVTIAALKIHVPHKDQRLLYKLKFDVVCDFCNFKVSMTLPASKPRKTVSMMCEYMPKTWVKSFPMQKELKNSQS